LADEDLTVPKFPLKILTSDIINRKYKKGIRIMLNELWIYLKATTVSPQLATAYLLRGMGDRTNFGKGEFVIS